ncbi:MAG TPA: hypothetical protein VK934_01365 [Fimbriimonas sp.]|nr:hypothetical protein [Fimbriimonas sp.]
MRYSGNGAYLFTRATSVVNCYRTADNTLVRSIYINGDHVAPNHDGSGFYYVYGREIWFYSMASRSGSLLYMEDEAYGGVERLALSVNNGTLAFETNRLIDGRHTIGLINLSTSTLVKRIVLGEGISGSQMEFVNGDQHIVHASSGLRMYSVTGGLVSSRTTTNIYEFAVSPDRTKIYAVDGSNSETVALNCAGSFSVIWKKGPIGLSSSMKITADGKVLIDQLGDGSQYLLRSYRTSDGTILGGFIDPISTGSFNGWMTAPDKNELLLPTFADTTRLERYAVNTDTGAGTNIGDMAEGNASYGMANLGSHGTPLFVTRNYSAFSPVNVRTATDGIYTGFTFGGSDGLSAIPELISPNGMFYARVGFKTGSTGWGLHVHKFPSNELVASHSFVDAWDNSRGFGWGNDSRLYVYNYATKKMRILSFNGTTLTKLREFVDVVSDWFKLSADGKRLVAYNIDSLGENFRIFNVQDGTSIGNVPMKWPDQATGIVYWTIVGPNLLALHEWVIVDGTKFKNQVRFHDLNQPTLPMVNITGYIDNQQQVYDTGVTRISPDGSLVVFLLVPQNLNADHTGLSKLTIMRVSDGAIIRQTTSLPVSSWVGFNSGDITSDGSGFLASSNLGPFFGINLPPIVATVKVNPTSVPGGTNSTGTATLTLPAPAGGTVVALSADAGLGVPATVTVPEGNKSVNFVISTTGVDADVVKKVTATLDGISLSADLKVLAAHTVQLMMDPVSVEEGQTSSGHIVLDAMAGPSGVSVSLSSNKSFVTVPASLNIPSGQSMGAFTANTSDPGATASALITATALGSSAQASLEVRSRFVITAELVPATVKGGNATELKVSINPVAEVDKTFNLSFDGPLAPPASVTIPAGTASVTLGVRTVPTALTKLATLTLSTPQGFTKSVNVTVQAPVVTGLLPTVTSVTGVTTVDVLVLLDGPAPESFTLPCTSNAPFATVPETVTVPPGAIFAVVKVTVKKVTSKKTATIKVGDKSFILTGFTAQ